MAFSNFTEDDEALKLRLYPAIEMDDDRFFEFCRLNDELRIERDPDGDLIVMAPAGGETGHKNAGLTTDVEIWARKNGNGVVFDSSTGFKLPNGATRSPDAAWVLRSQLEKLTREQRRKFLPLCPDFVIELRLPSDRLSDVKKKMAEYMVNGARLGWLIDPDAKTVYVYRAGSAEECLQDKTEISGDPELPEFVLDLRPIWREGF